MADTEWPVGPPHLFAGDRRGEPSDVCKVCGVTRDRAIHSAVFWARDRQISLVPATTYLAWKESQSGRSPQGGAE